jgi:hypothetical protein
VCFDIDGGLTSSAGSSDTTTIDAPARFVKWMNDHQHKDRRTGHIYRYHSRSDAHSIALCEEIVRDLVDSSRVLRRQASLGIVFYDINCRYTWLLSGKTKTLDLAVGLAKDPLPPAGGALIRQGAVADVLIACEAKTVMTEHGKSKPRVYDELSSSHEIVHQGRPDAIAAGITLINVAKTFVSPLRQQPGQGMYISEHKQPNAAAGMVSHLRGLPIRDDVGRVGFDAYSSVVVECDNITKVRLWSDPPAPQPGDKDHYATFIARICRFYDERFSELAVRL